MTVRIGLISDTHGLLRPEALDALQGSDHILHAGDIGAASILEALGAMAPVTAIRGNNDTAPWAMGLPETECVRLGGIAIYMLHDLKTLSTHAPDETVDVIVVGHSHKPLVERRSDGILRVNPGSAGPRRFKLPITVGQLLIADGRVEASIVPLPIEA
ncbi:metallophosphoesterase family protein [Cognatilysobacter terrigena]|uniref:metallophosphoesterase family protein n=1 Tax=Cognatilysobacter terrigena TaxID=2488749 RepID=UPI00105BC2EE|nr:metallophosphoesterase family protein [Lysobacter terrigena]